ncbi:uncharacterized protein GIQ15_02426 [Arthroderma uncinatum]|uniref:uncharacterized protein n=1 Tax=Arthroderma uncinatum TaxID=74035 RepID=UPI00144A8A0C|nr:uncharacterized protein GIQ15_02426 [Arthroderma uncinatum]KAF3483102.1 hypothetical protein GIQ15_02426 [Arthroderma uncinatum]
MTIQIHAHSSSQELKGQNHQDEQKSFAKSTFPVLPDASDKQQATETLNSWISGAELEQKHTTPTTSVLQLAWALVIAAYTDSNDVVFDLSVAESAASAAASVYPFWVKIEPDQVVGDALVSLGHAASPQCGLTPMVACQIHNVLFIQHDPQETANITAAEGFPGSLSDGYPLSITAVIQKKGISLYARFDPVVISSTLGQMILDQLVHVVSRIQSNPTDNLKMFLGICAKGLKQVQTWNSRLQLYRKELCIHEVITRRAWEYPFAPAVCAWDGSLTYSELEAESTSLANRLMELCHETDKFVGLFLEKSMWTPVSMLAVLKTGNAFMLLDPSLPDKRLQALCRISQAAIIISLPGQSARAHRLGPPVIIVKDEFRETTSTSPPPSPSSSSPPQSLPSSPSSPFFPLLAVSPHQTAYAAFTSGSSGEPKGVVVDHSAVCSGVDAYCSSIGLNHESRVFQFASYSFTISVVDHLITLMQGACLCIPSADQLKDRLLDTMLAFNVNWMTTTPSVARALDPESIRSLKTLCLAGEILTRSDLEKWRGRVDLKSIYGQSENTLAALVDTKTDASSPSDLGYAFAANCWIVHPRDSHRLVPIGVEGELLLEAPTMARGYLNNVEQTQAMFIHNPPWLQDVRPGEGRRFLKTGDIVRYRPEDGSVQYIGRKGTQVKLRGQRVELTEVEFQLRRQFPTADAVVAEIVTLDEERSHDAILVAFVAVGKDGGYIDSSPDVIFAKPTSSFAQQSQQALSQLREILPEYMVPTTIVPILTVPLTPSGKLNRRLLRNMASKLGNRLLGYHILAKKAHRHPCTAKELILQRICASILRLNPVDINMDDTFFRVGGSSISAMQLVGQAREAGLSFTVSDVYKQSSLAALAKCQGKSPSHSEEAVSPGKSVSVTELKAKLVHQSAAAIDAEKILDIFPCTETQQFMLENKEGGYFLLHFSGILDTGKLQAACQRLVKTHTALRSVFVLIDGVPSQIVQDEIDFPFIVHTCPPDQDPISAARGLCSADGDDFFPLGVPPLQFTLIRGTGEHVLIMRLSHAQYDGICQHIIVSDLCTFYQDPRHPGMPTDFAQYSREMSRRQTPEKFSFWRNALEGSTITKLPYTVSQTETENAIIQCSTEVTLPAPPSGITLASVVKAAWSSVLREVTGDHDVVFGQLVNLRGMDATGIYRVVGPCYNIVPIRLQYQLFSTIQDLLRAAQDQHVQGIPFETAEWFRVVSNSTNWAPDTRPQSLVIHQNFSTEMDIQMDNLQCKLADYISIEPTDMSLDLYSEPRGDRLGLTLVSSAHFIAENDMQALLEKLCRTLTLFTTASENVLTARPSDQLEVGRFTRRD